MRIIMAVLSEESIKTLKNRVKILYEVDQLKPDQFMHHITLAFKPKDEDISFIKRWDDGVCKVFCRSNIYNDAMKNQAITVDVINGKEEKLDLSCLHITVSTGNKPPVTSNNLLRIIDGSNKVDLLHLVLDAKVEYI